MQQPNSLILSLIIFATVASSIVGMGTFIVSKSLTYHTNYTLVSGFFSSHPPAQVVAFSPESVPNVLGATSPELTPEEEVAAYPDLSVRSVVNFMYANGFAFDYASRVIMAKEVGMTTYNGTPEQNMVLMKILYYKGGYEKTTF
jgi:hypothetical protein